MRCVTTILLVALASAMWTSPSGAETPDSRIMPLVAGDEPIVVTQHVIQTPNGPLRYEARAGRLPIRVDETGEVHASVFFVAYVVKTVGSPRPMTIAWNGGPTIPSIYVHTEFLGPRRITKTGIVDNPLTLLTRSDLVFYDPVETGFSRPAKPEFAPEFFNMKGDVAVAAEFVRAYRARFDAQSQPLFLLGESYGVWRTGGVAELLARRGVDIAGLVLVSGGVPSIKMPMSFWNAMNVQTRAATAFYYKRLPASLMTDPQKTVEAADKWAAEVYLPALENPQSLSIADKEAVAEKLAEFTGFRADQIDHDTLVMHTQQYLKDFFAEDPERQLSEVDTRLFGEERQLPLRHLLVSQYLRQEIGYATDLGYNGELGYTTDLGYRALEAGYVPTPGPERRSTGKQWLYNQSEDAAAANAAGRIDGEVAHMFNANPPWVQATMSILPKLRVFVALGRFDPTNSCEGEARAVATLPPGLTQRIELKCYDAGHMMYRDERQRAEVSRDLQRFITETSR